MLLQQPEIWPVRFSPKIILITLSSMVAPILIRRHPLAPRYGAGNADFAPVPEAAGFALAGVGLLGLVYVGRCYRQG